MFEIFSRLNSGGVMLKPQEIRMSIYYSPFYEKIVSELNLNKTWRKFLGKQEPDFHMTEIEVLVRAFAMLEMSKQYKSPLRNFLNEFSKRAMNFTEEKLDFLAQIFFDFWSSCGNLTKSAFRNEKNKFVISVFDAVFVTVCEKIKVEGLNGRKIVPESLDKLKNDKVFIASSQGNTESVASVTNRLERARNIIELK